MRCIVPNTSTFWVEGRGHTRVIVCAQVLLRVPTQYIDGVFEVVPNLPEIWVEYWSHTQVMNIAEVLTHYLSRVFEAVPNLP